MITKVDVENKTGLVFGHVSLKNVDGSIYKCRQNGQVKTWKTRPDHFVIPVMRGLYQYGYIQNSLVDNNSNEWNIL